MPRLAASSHLWRGPGLTSTDDAATSRTVPISGEGATVFFLRSTRLLSSRPALTGWPTPAQGCAARGRRRPGWHIGFACFRCCCSFTLLAEAQTETKIAAQPSETKLIAAPCCSRRGPLLCWPCTAAAAAAATRKGKQPLSHCAAADGTP
jgi:hypothetical protein